MAKNYSDIYTSVYDKGNSMSFGNAMLRGNGVPLDITEVYDSYESAVLYAANNAVAYEGQLLAVTENGDTTVYVITPSVQGTITVNADGTGAGTEVAVYLKEVGSAPQVDGKTVELVEGTLKLVGLSDLDNTKTYQPVLVNGVIEWHEPSATTVEGLDTRLSTAEDDIDDLQTTVGDENSGLVKAVAENTSAIAENAANIKSLQDTANDYVTADSTLKSELETKIADALAEAKQYADDNDADTVYDDTQVKADITAEASARAAADTALETSLKEYVGEQIGLQAHFSSKVVTSTTEMTDSTVLYLMKTAETGDDLYEEWILIDGVATKIGTTATDLSDYSTTAEIEELIEAAKTALTADITALSDTHNADVEKLTTDVNSVTDDLAAYKTTVASTYETKEVVTTKVGEVQTQVDNLKTVVDGKANKADVESEVGRLDEAIEAVRTTADTNAQTIVTLQNTDTEIKGRLDDLEAVGAQKNVVNSVTSEFTLSEAGQLAVNAIASEKVSGLDAALQGLQDSKVDKITTEYNGEQVAWTLLSPENQEKLSALTIGDTGSVEISGKVNADNVEGLDSYITSKRDTVPGLLSSTDKTKIDGIAAGAQVNAIEKIKVNGAELSIDTNDKSVNIPFATNDTIGVVLSSSAENKVSVGEDGTMEVNSLNVNRLVQTEGDTLIRNGGSSVV